MHSILPIEDLDIPEMEPYLTMRRLEQHRLQGIFVAEGDKVVHRLIKSHFGVESLLVLPERLEEFKEALRVRKEAVNIYVAAKAILEKLTGYSMYQGVLAIGLIPSPVPLEDLISMAKPNPLFAALDGVMNSENVGALIRNAAAFGLDGVIVGETCCSPYLRRAVRNSMGGIFKVPVVESLDLTASMRRLKARGIRCVAAHPGAHQKPLVDTELRGGTCLIFGSEGYGISERTLELCDSHAAISMRHGIDSLNVASAAGVFFYEATRQRLVERIP